MSDSDSSKKSKRVRLYDEPLPAVINSDHGRKLSDRPDYIRSQHEGLSALDNLSTIERMFVLEHTKEYNPIKACIKAGYPASRAHLQAFKLLSDFRIQAAIQEVEHERLRRTKVDGDYILSYVFQIATADPSKLIERIIPCCRYCWGENNEYQRTHAEFEVDFEKYNTEEPKKGNKKLPFDKKGGTGYNPRIGPNPSCPNCFGDGDYQNPVIVHKDTRFFTPEQRALYAGAESGKNGHKTFVKDQGAAINFIRNIGEALLERQRQDNKATDWNSMTEEELQQIVSQGRELGLLDEDDE